MPHRIDSFYLYQIDLDRKSWKIRVELYDEMLEIEPSTRSRGNVKAYGMCCYPDKKSVDRRDGVITVIQLWAGARKLDLVAMHESVHAAFEFASTKMWYEAEERTAKEEHIVRTAEVIYDKLRKKLIERGHLS